MGLWLNIFIGILTTGIYFFLRHIRRNDDYWKTRGVVYEPRISIFTMIKAFMTRPLHELLQESYKKYGRIHGRFELSTPGLLIADPELLRDVLVKDFNVFNSRRDFTFPDDILSKMVSILNGEDWKRVRTIITPAFTSKKMRKMTGIINSCSETVLNTLREHYDQKISFDCRKLFGAFTMDVIASSAFATKIDSHHDANNPFVVHAKNAFSKQAVWRMLMFMIVPPYLWRILKFDVFDKPAMDFFSSVTLQVIEERRKKGTKGNDFLQMMIDASDEVLEGEKKVAAFETMDANDEEDHYGRIDNNANITYTTKKLSQDEIIAQCVLFFIVGYETSASTLSFAAYNLALNHECQEKLIQEVDDAFERNNEMTYDVIRDMKYLDCVLSESLRLFPPLLVAERTAMEDYKLGSTGITVEKGMVVSYPIYAMHRDPELFEDPETFNPERFMGENRRNHHPYAYLPFGAGPRNCLGMRFALMEIKLCLCHIVRNYRLRRAPETKVPLEFSFSQGFLTTKELPLLAEKRTDIHSR